VVESHKAEQLAALYDTHVKEIAGAYERVTERRQSRLAYLESLVPSGTGVPEDASPADRAVLIAAFRGALEQTKGASRQEREQLLAEAVRYGDDAMQPPCSSTRPTAVTWPSSTAGWRRRMVCAATATKSGS
jgi:hypothetical protein